MLRNILIADDHALVRGGIVSALQRLYPDARVYETCSAAEALECAGQLPVDLDLALVDLFMPDMDGFEFLRKLCHKYPDLPVAVLSASEEPSHIDKALEIGAAGYIAKSVQEHEFTKALNIISAGGVYPPPGKRRPASGTTYTMPMPSPEPGAHCANLTSRQREILELLGQGMSNKKIARQLNLSENTVKVQVSAILRTLQLDNRTQAGLMAGQLAG
jgi:DNA-binding NarL/FixJ family response regulator